MKPNNPIEQVVIIVKENHAFDNYFGTFPGANGITLPAASDPPASDHRRHLSFAVAARQFPHAVIERMETSQAAPSFYKIIQNNS